MSNERQLQASLWLLVAILTAGAIDLPTRGPRKLPAPRGYVAAVIVWSILGLVADAGQARAAAVMGWVTVIAALFKTRVNATVTNFLGWASQVWGTGGQQQQGTTA